MKITARLVYDEPFQDISGYSIVIIATIDTVTFTLCVYK